MIKNFSLTPEEETNLKELQKTVKDRWQYVRITTLILIDKGYSLVKIQEILGIDDNSIHRYISVFLNIGLPQKIAFSTKYRKKLEF